MDIDNLFQNLLQPLLAYVEINLQLQGIFRNASVHKAQILRKDFIENKTAQRRFYDIRHFSAVRHLLCNFNFNS